MTRPNLAISSASVQTRRSLAWRLVLPAPLALIVAVASIWVVVPRIVESNATAAAVLTGQQVAGLFKTVRAYYTENVVDKVKRKGTLKVSFDHRTDSQAIPLPATFIEDVSELLSKEDTSIALYSKYPFPNRKDRQLDVFQRDAWDFLIANPGATFSRNEVHDGRKLVRVAVADTMIVQACVDCHNSNPASPKKDWKLGDVRGVLEVTSVIDQALAHGDALAHRAGFGAIAVGVCVLGLLLLATRSVTRPLSGLVSAMLKLAAGDFDVRLPGRGRADEIGAMADAVEMFKVKALEQARATAEQDEAKARAVAADRKAEMHKLADSFENAIGRIVEAVSSASTKLELAASTLAHSAETAQQLSDIVADASEEASSNVETVASAAGVLSASVTEISRQVNQSSDIAREAVIQADKTDARITELSHAASRIGDVVKLITAIAEQTNLLALNATIEAARAGGAGRGFAVVAQEVKALAAQTAGATGEIGAQIASMQAATQDSVTAIKEIGTTINKIAQIASAIAVAVEQQGKATQEISYNVKNAAQGTAQVATNIGDVSKAAGETGLASGQVLSSARSLSSEGGRLQIEVERFLTTVRAG